MKKDRKGLCLLMEKGESIHIGDNIKITRSFKSSPSEKQIKLIVTAPDSILIETDRYRRCIKSRERSLNENNRN